MLCGLPSSSLNTQDPQNKMETPRHGAHHGMLIPKKETTEARPIKYVVVRDGHRVSDREYNSPTDPLCVAEIKFWSGVSKGRSYGEKVEAVQYDSKKHRVW